MTPQEKAEQLLAKMNVIHYRTLVGKNKDMRVPISMYDSQIKQCALMAVDEILDLFLEESRHTRYWEDVIKEIKKL
jgi:hypothetical protein